jgi:GNAT superfamily N-acetyltransferase
MTAMELIDARVFLCYFTGRGSRGVHDGIPPQSLAHRSDCLQTYSFVPAQTISPADRAPIINRAYANYYVPMRVTAEQMAAIDRFYDVDLNRSLVALVGRDAVGMALLCIRGRSGWITGVGVLPEHRRHGLGRALIGRLIEQARHAGVREIFLEVITQNTPAWRLYADAGFEPIRELLIWRRSSESDALPIPEERLAQADAGGLLAHFDGWHSQPATWQRAAPTLAHMVVAGRLKGYRLDWRGAAAAYCLVSGHDDTLSLMDVGIDPATDITTPGRILLQALAHMYWGRALTISNVPADDPLNRVLAALRFLVTVRQIEMRLTL